MMSHQLNMKFLHQGFALDEFSSIMEKFLNFYGQIPIFTASSMPHLEAFLDSVTSRIIVCYVSILNHFSNRLLIDNSVQTVLYYVPIKQNLFFICVTVFNKWV